MVTSRIIAIFAAGSAGILAHELRPPGGRQIHRARATHRAKPGDGHRQRPRCIAGQRPALRAPIVAGGPLNAKRGSCLELSIPADSRPEQQRHESGTSEQPESRVSNAAACNGKQHAHLGRQQHEDGISEASDPLPGHGTDISCRSHVDHRLGERSDLQREGRTNILIGPDEDERSDQYDDRGGGICAKGDPRFTVHLQCHACKVIAGDSRRVRHDRSKKQGTSVKSPAEQSKQPAGKRNHHQRKSCKTERSGSENCVVQPSGALSLAGSEQFGHDGPCSGLDHHWHVLDDQSVLKRGKETSGCDGTVRRSAQQCKDRILRSERDCSRHYDRKRVVPEHPAFLHGIAKIEPQFVLSERLDPKPAQQSHGQNTGEIVCEDRAPHPGPEHQSHATRKPSEGLNEANDGFRPEHLEAK